MKKTKAMPTQLIAPCGMSCRLCWGYIRDTNTCPGCRSIGIQESQKSKVRSSCIIKNCEHIAGAKTNYCSEHCGSFPCARLKGLDKRYRKKYGMSMIDNLHVIHTSGIRHFIRREKEKWTCPECGELICVHKPACLSCGYNWNG